jgi:hypothetical protein
MRIEQCKNLHTKYVLTENMKHQQPVRPLPLRAERLGPINCNSRTSGMRVGLYVLDETVNWKT